MSLTINIYINLFNSLSPHLNSLTGIQPDSTGLLFFRRAMVIRTSSKPGSEMTNGKALSQQIRGFAPITSAYQHTSKIGR